MLTICDIFAALIEERTYKPTMPREKAYEILLDMKGKLERPLGRGVQGSRAEAMTCETSWGPAPITGPGLILLEFSLDEMVGARGFEPPTPSLPD